MPSGLRIVIVGASVAGIETAVQVRRRLPGAQVTVVDAEPHEPYDRPPLSKAMVLDPVAGRRSLLVGDETVAPVLGDAAVQVDLDRRLVTLASGRTLPWDRLVVATGAEAVVPGWAARASAPTLRSLDDATQISAQARTASSVVVAGGGLVGTELASALASSTRQLTIVDRGDSLARAALGAELSHVLTTLHHDHGVRIMSRDRVVDSLDGPGSVTLASGRVVIADLVVAALGASPRTSLLAGALPDATEAVPCDGFGRVAGLDHVFAVGDVSAWQDAAGASVSRQHWTNAIEQARVLAAVLAGEDVAPHRPSGYVWSDQFGVRFEKIGRVDPGLHAGTIEHPSGTIHVYGEDGWCVGAAAAGVGRPFASLRKRLRTPHRLDHLLATHLESA